MSTEAATVSSFSVSHSPISREELRKLDAHWRAANYLSVGQIYLYRNPLLHEPLRLEHIKPRLFGYWGTTPGLNFIYVHFNRLIKKYDLNVIYIAGPIVYPTSNASAHTLNSGSGIAWSRTSSTFGTTARICRKFATGGGHTSP